MNTTSLLAPFLIGLFGSGHCVGMCGPLILAAVQRHPTARELQLHQSLYYAGKTLTYALLGAVAGALAGLLGSGLEGTIGGAQRAISLALGLAMIAFGVGLLAGARWLEGGGLAASLPGFRHAMAFLVRERRPLATLGLGALNGILPCGLVYAALTMAAATGSAGEGAAVMAAFGLGTVPALFLIGVAGYALKPAWRSRLHRAAGALLILAGLPTVLRAMPFWGLIMHIFHG